MDKAAEIERLIGPSLEAMGYELVRVRLSGGHRPTLQVMAERTDRGAMTVDDCADLSRAVSALLDVEDPLPGAYSLEVSTPGLDRPLVRAEDYRRFAGREASLETRSPIDGRRRFRGRLVGLEGDRVRIATAEGESDVPLAEIAKAKLVVPADIVAESARRQQR